ncbi:uncharacterized protein LOC123699006 [Colias croceus]|uniref:uncharacterized protein LOC123698272 n=1 Tax=Colias crocea TaxID=72248 RepID=UPI001E28146C|nr:uncharacterized protein LOC123698272 [Colias croceus]XP_045501821.1 uncharacterized protein LOC123699006 [Colias croceus]
MDGSALCVEGPHALFQQPWLVTSTKKLKAMMKIHLRESLKTTLRLKRHETEGDDEVSTVNKGQFPDQDYEASSTTSPHVPLKTPNTSADPSDLIIRPSRTILLGKDKHILWSSQQSRSQSRRSSKNIDT